MAFQVASGHLQLDGLGAAAGHKQGTIDSDTDSDPDGVAQDIRLPSALES